MFWHLQQEELFHQLETTREGLSSEEALIRLKKFGPNTLSKKKKAGSLSLFFKQFNTPFIYLLLFAATLSFILYSRTDTIIIMIIVIGSAFLTFFQEKGALGAVEKLMHIVKIKSEVFRGGFKQYVLSETVVPGDILYLQAGEMIPADCRLLEAKDLHVDESTLSGESMPVEKHPGVVLEETPLSRRSNCLFAGTHVVSGTGIAVVAVTAAATELGKLAAQLQKSVPKTDFEKGLQSFGFLLLQVTSAIAAFIFLFNIFLGREVIESLLFTLAIAIGLTPQLLPAIVMINLSKGAKEMAKRSVIVKKLTSIENFGNMNILCMDKTGTLSLGKMALEHVVDCDGSENEDVLFLAQLNAFFQTSFANPIDKAILAFKDVEVGQWKKVDEVPYDYTRRRLSILCNQDQETLLITKGAFKEILSCCKEEDEAHLQEQFLRYSNEGYRIIALATKKMPATQNITNQDECGMTFRGFLIFLDPPKPDVSVKLERLKSLGITLKMITGDHHLVALHLAKEVGMSPGGVITGEELAKLSDQELSFKAQEISIFAETDPKTKERIVMALRKKGSIVGYLGDGINDAAALFAADVSISVDSAEDVAKESAHIVLMEKDLGVLEEGVRSGRKTFANTLKYVLMSTSANFGNMFSMAWASLFLPFLPLLPKQVLLTNLLTDCPEMAIATDHVDEERMERSSRWNISFIRRFMIIFGLISTLFDFATFGVLLYLLHANKDQFRTGWFLESIISASLIVLVIRTARPAFQSRPSQLLLWSVIGVDLFTLYLPYSPLATLLGLVPLEQIFYLYLLTIVFLYILFVEAGKKIFYTRLNKGVAPL